MLGMAKIMESDGDNLIEMVRLFDKIIKHLVGSYCGMDLPLSKRAPACLYFQRLCRIFNGHHPIPDEDGMLIKQLICELGTT